MTVCYFGPYARDYARNKLQIEGLRVSGVEVIECHTEAKGLAKYIQLVRNYWRMRQRCQVMVVGVLGHSIMPLAWLLARLSGKKIVFDAFISRYDSTVYDRSLYSPGSLGARRAWLSDWLACILADVVLLDAAAHVDYFVHTFHLAPERFRVLGVTCDPTVMFPRPRQTAEFIVHFHGTYIPTQGIPVILKAAQLLAHEKIVFRLVGRRGTYGEAHRLARRLQLRNVHFLDYVPYPELAKLMSEASICLGMFGTTGKAQRTAAFKVIEALAVQRPVITADTPAMRETFLGGVHVLFCRSGDARDLAGAIMRLKRDPIQAERLARQGRHLFQETMTPAHIGRQLAVVVRQVVS